MARVCVIHGCGRSIHAEGLCQAHYEQAGELGGAKSSTPKRAPRAGKVKYLGLSLTPECAQRLDRLAEEAGVAANQLVVDIVEAWALREAGRLN